MLPISLRAVGQQVDHSGDVLVKLLSCSLKGYMPSGLPSNSRLPNTGLKLERAFREGLYDAMP